MSGNATGGTLGSRDVTTGLSEAVMEVDAGINDAVASDSGEMAAEPGKAPANVLHVDFGEKASYSEDSVIRDIAEAAEGVSGNTERIAVVTALRQTPGLTESAIAPDVLAKLLPDDVVVLPELKQVGGGLAYRFAKRAFDVVSCSCALVVLAIPMAAIAVAIKAESPGPVIYAQTRVGKGGKLFKIYKFRSMYTDAEAKGARWAAGDDPRITPLGKRLRMTRLDEIPQFWNVVKGDMSLIGPRPERPVFHGEFCKRIKGWEQRLAVRPGITGLAQVTGGYELLPKEKARYDIEYIETRSVAKDWSIIWSTLRTMVTGEGAR